MTQEGKELLLKDLCARLPYKVVVTDGVEDYVLTSPFLYRYIEMGCKPYLRPMSSMTEKEKRAFDKFMCIDEDAWLEKENGYFNQAKIMSGGIDWLDAHHFDYRGLIPMGLALEAPEDMYKNE